MNSRYLLLRIGLIAFLLLVMKILDSVEIHKSLKMLLDRDEMERSVNTRGHKLQDTTPIKDKKHVLSSKVTKASLTIYLAKNW